jgi:energy-coupling factor transporter ATP-binding protein EcfA2
MSPIEKITIKRFKQIDDLSLDLNETTLLIGANNSGKSSVLQALHFAVSVAQTAMLVGENVKWGNDRFELSFNPSQLLYSPVSDVLSLAFGGQLTEAAHSQIEIQIVCADGSSCTVAVKRGRNRNIGVSLAGRTLGNRLMNMDNPFTIYAPGLAGIPKDERYMSPGVVRRIVARGDANLVLRNVLHMILTEEEKGRAKLWKSVQEKKIPAADVHAWKGPWKSFLEDMNVLFPGIQFNIEFDEQRDENIEVFFTRPGAPKLPIDAAGTSILQASQILAYIALFKPSVLILDEPDSHLHPNNQRAMCNLVNSLSERMGFRALISTHSRHVMDAMRESSQVVWMSGGKKVDFSSVSTAAMLMQLGALDSVDYFTNGQLRCLFATEDSSDDSISALNVLLRCSGFNMRQTEIRSYSGCSKIEAALVLHAFLAEKAPHVKFVVHRDRDYMHEDAAIKFTAGISGMGAYPFLTGNSDVENYFLNADHIAHLNPGLTPQRVQELIDQATDATKQKSIELLINIRTDAAIRGRNGGPAHNAGELAAAASVDYEGSPSNWRRGKVVLKAVKALLQQELKKHPVILESTPHLVCAELTHIKNAIWPPLAAPAK